MANVNSAPRGKINGVRDDSIRQILPLPEQLPTHLAWFFTFAQKGGDVVEFVDGNRFDALFGSSTLDYNSKYVSHTTPFIKGGLGTGTILAVQRLFPKDMKPESTLALSLDVLETLVPLYEVDEITKAPILDANGAKIPVLDGGEPVLRPGVSVKWVVGEVSRVNAAGEIITSATVDKFPVANKFGVASVSQGDQADADSGALSTRFPIFELAVSDRGEDGNNQGIRLFAAHELSVANDTENLQARLGEFLYALQMVVRPDAASTGNIRQTLAPGAYALFAASELIVDRDSNVNYGYGDLMLQWNVDDAQGRTKGPFNKLHVYEANIQAVQELIAAKEAAIDLDFTATGKQINFVDFKNINGIPYQSVRQLGALDGGVLLNDTSVLYATGGDDGTMTPEVFEELALEQLVNFGELEGKPYLDYVRYPFHQFYDSGYSMAVKNVIPSLTGKRYDFITMLSTQVASEPINSAQVDSSTLIALVSRARTFPESTLFGTSNFRTMVAMHAGKDATRQWRGTIPTVYECFINFCLYMGAANGRWNPSRRPDVWPNNVVSRLTGLQNTYKPDRPYNNDWNNGGILVISNDRFTDMIPAVRTVYNNPTSILVGGINAFIFADLEYLTQIAWRRVVGDSNLTKAERLEKQETVMNELIRQRGNYDGRTQISLRAYYTAEDDLNGFSSHLDITVGGNNMPTVQTFTLIAQRLEDLVA